MDRSEIMRRIRSKETKPEVALRKLLWRCGCRGYRKNWGRPSVDVAFTRRKVAVFLDSCFWHGCPEHFRLPKTRPEWWAAKMAANRERDARATRTWEERGWTVLRYWTHAPLNVIAASVMEILRLMDG